MTIDELLAKVPEEFRPVVAQYGPALLAMSAEELWAWIQLLLEGKSGEAMAKVVASLDNAELFAEMEKLDAAWATANAKNTEKMALQRSASLAILRVLLTAALAMVGL